MFFPHWLGQCASGLNTMCLNCVNYILIHTHAAVDVLPSLSVVSSRAGVETRSVVRHPLPLQEQEESIGATHAAVVTGTLQTAPAVLQRLPVGWRRQQRVDYGTRWAADRETKLTESRKERHIEGEQEREETSQILLIPGEFLDSVKNPPLSPLKCRSVDTAGTRSSCIPLWTFNTEVDLTAWFTSTDLQI